MLDIVDTNPLVISNDLGADLRLPVVGSRVVQQPGIHSVVGYRPYLASGVRTGSGEVTAALLPPCDRPTSSPQQLAMSKPWSGSSASRL